MKIDEYFEIGYIGKTRGLKGELQISFTYAEPEKLKISAVFIEINNKMVPYFVRDYKIPMPGIGYFNFEDIDHIDKAAFLTKKKIFLPNRLKPKRKKGEFLYSDLIGFNADDVQKGDLGKILDVQEYPQQFIATVNYQEKEILIPLNEAFIQEINMDKKFIHFDLPEGLLDLYLEQS